MDVSASMVADMLTEFESEKTRDLQEKLDLICEYVENASLDDISGDSCGHISNIINLER